MVAITVIKTAIEESLKKLGLSNTDVRLEHPEVEAHGDYSSNVALILSKTVKKPPREVAVQIVKELSEDTELAEIVEKIDVAGPGFINFYLTQNALLNELKEVKKEKGKFGSDKSLKNKKIMVEFTDPNPFKEFHIGHLFSNTVGESLSRLFQSQGATVQRANYQGDVGMHVAKSVWGMMKLENEMPADSTPLAEKAQFMGRAYAFGATKFEKDEQVKQEITDLNKKIYQQDSLVIGLYKKGRKWSLDYFETIYKRLGTKFDYYYFESVAGKAGLEFVKENLKKGIFQESQGAIVFPGEKYGLHTRVFVNSLGLPTYEAKDLGLAPTKYKDFPYDESVIVTGNEIDEYFRVLVTALKQINPELGEKVHHISHGMVRLPEGKMSSRTGKVLTGEWLLNEAVKAASELAMKKGVQVKDGHNVITDIHIIGGQSKRDDVSEMVGIGAVKYALLKSGIGNDVVFDFHQIVNLEGNSGPYLQYTYARCQSVLSKSDSKGRSSDSEDRPYQINSEELAILRWIYRFPEVVQDAATQYAPNLVCTFLYELAQRFNTFYNKHSVLRPKDEGQRTKEEITQFRLLLTQAVAQVLKNGLGLLGIQAPEKM